MLSILFLTRFGYSKVFLCGYLLNQLVNNDIILSCDCISDKSEVASEKVEKIASEQVDTTASEQVVLTTEQAETNSEQEKLADKIPNPVKNEPANSADFNSTELKTSSEQQSLDDNSSEDK